MSNESAPEYLHHKDNRYIQVRLDLMLLYRNESKAKIFRVLESWTNTKYAEWYKGVADSKEQGSEPPAEDLWITMSYDQFSLFVYGTIRHDTIKQQVDELVALKHISRRVHPTLPYGPPQYLINKNIVQKALDELEFSPNLFDLASILTAPRKKRTPQERYPQGGGKKQGRDPGKIPPGTGETSYPSNNTSNNTENPSKNESTYSEHGQIDEHSASASQNAPLSSSSQDDVSQEEREEKPTPPEQAIDSYSHASPEEQGYKQSTPEPVRQQVAAPRPAASSARREPRPTKPKGKAQFEVYFSLEGQRVKDWTETITGLKLSATAANASACNTLGKQETMNLENYQAIQKLIDADAYIQSRNIVVDVQELASDSSKWRWERWIQLVMRQQAPVKPAPKPVLPSYAHLSDDEYYDMKRRKSHGATATNAW